jgi:hypothetical protein
MSAVETHIIAEVADLVTVLGGHAMVLGPGAGVHGAIDPASRPDAWIAAGPGGHVDRCLLVAAGGETKVTLPWSYDHLHGAVEVWVNTTPLDRSKGEYTQPTSTTVEFASPLVAGQVLQVLAAKTAGGATASIVAAPASTTLAQAFDVARALRGALAAHADQGAPIHIGAQVLPAPPADQNDVASLWALLDWLDQSYRVHRETSGTVHQVRDDVSLRSSQWGRP